MAAHSFQEDTTSLIKESADIVQLIGEHVILRKNGSNFKGLCPFHPEKTPSFMVNPQRQSYHCFGCNEGGDVFSFLMKSHGMSFPEALKERARRYQIPLPESNLSQQDRERLQKIDHLHTANALAAEIYHELLLTDPRAQAARDYLAKRKTPAEIIAKFSLGFAPESWDFLLRAMAGKFSPEIIAEAGLVVQKEKGGYYDRFRNRILFPIRSVNGKVIGFGGRILDDGQPKYLNSPETLIFDKSRTLFGLYENREAIRKEKRCIIVEGNFDLLSLTAHGIANVVAPLGTALTNAHLRTIKGYAEEVVLLFDGDQAGIKAAIRAVPLFLAEQIAARIAILPADHDPDSLIREQGGEKLLEYITAARPLPEYLVQELVERYGLSLEGKTRIVAELQPILAAIKNQKSQHSLFISHFSQKLGIPPASFLPDDHRPGSQRQARESQPTAAPQEIKIPRKQKQLLEFLLGYPEYIADFLSVGLEEIILDPVGIEILDHMKKLAGEKGPIKPEQILEFMPAGPLRSYITGLLVDPPSIEAETVQPQVNEWLAWLRKESLKRKKEKLNVQINEAQQAQNEILCKQLTEQIKNIDHAMAS